MRAYRMRAKRLVFHQLTATMILITIQIALLLSSNAEAICCSANNRHTLTAYHRHDIESSRISPLHYQQRQHRLSIINERKSIPKEEQEREQREIEFREWRQQRDQRERERQQRQRQREDNLL